MITLYHGSNVVIDKIDLSKGMADKDFGQGFYLTDIKGQAEQMATRRVRMAGSGAPIVTTFNFDENCLYDGTLKVLSFDIPSKEWALFVMNNREASVTGYRHDYDIVIGPVADDGVAFQLERYSRKMITLETLVKELIYRHLSRQYFFGSDRAITKLQRI